jgi:L-ascorbate metabolism protein UlaG (beta-lactamase superfamily)
LATFYLKKLWKKITDVDVLLVPVGGKYTIDAKSASKVISSIEPGIVFLCITNKRPYRSIRLGSFG